MELKKFEAPTLAEALKVVKRELGPEAIIISTKNNKSGWGLMNKSSVEVTAAVSEDALDRKQKAETRMTEQQRDLLQGRPSQKVIKAYDVLSGSRLDRELDDYLTRQNSATPTKVNLATQNRQNTATANPAPRVASPQSTLNAALNRTQQQQAPSRQSPAPISQPITQRRYIDIRDDEGPAEQAASRSVENTRLGGRSAAAQAQAQSNNNSAPAASVSMRGASTSILPKLLAQLMDSGIDAEFVRELGDELKMLMIREHITREDILRLQLGRILMGRLRVARPLSERLRIPNTPRVITFIGPTGVGKTTTIAKIAAELVIHQKRPVTLATTDTYKIAAVEQLQTYANILRIPLEVCPSAESLSQLVSRASAEEVILVDTAGYGPKDDKRLTEMRDIVKSVRTETHLCVSALTRDRDLLESVRRFKIFEPDHLVITKIDETTSFGSIFNVAVKSHLPLSYFTMGQRVPEDMEVATKERVADLVLNFSGEV